MAIQAGVPIVPVSIAGAQKIMPKGELAIHPGEIVIRFATAVDPSAYSVGRLGELLTRVHAQVAAGLPADQQPVVPASEPAESAAT